MENISFEEIVSLIKKFDNIVLYRHVKPDFDAAGSAYALKEIIELNFKSKNVYLNGENKMYGNYFYPQNKASLEIVKNSLAIICDTSVISRCDDESYKEAKEHLIIDHHIANNFEYLNRYVDENECSTSIIIAKLALKMGLRINQKAASYLYGGIISDTQKLSIDKVNYETFEIISFLAKENIDIPEINRAVYDESIDKFKAKSFYINKIKIEGDVAYFYAKKKDLHENKISATIVKDFVDTMNCIRGVEKWAVFAQTDDGSYTASLRSHGPIIIDIAHKYNGGGHNLACGITKMSFKDTKEAIQLLKEIK